MDKKFWQSKTFWFGVLYVVVSAAGLFGFADFKPDATLVEVVGALTGVAVIVLRILTNKGISL